MAKRFTDTNKWKKPLLRGLEGPYKLLLLYIWDDCDHAGIWDVDMDVACLRIGFDISEEDARNAFGDACIPCDNGTKWFFPGYIDFQYGQLNPSNRVHKSAISLLSKYKLLNNSITTKKEGPSKPLDRGSQGCKDKYIYKDKDKDNSFSSSRGGAGGDSSSVSLIPAATEWRTFIESYPKPFNHSCPNTSSAFHESVQAAGSATVLADAVRAYSEFIQKSNTSVNFIPKAQRWLQEMQWKTCWKSEIKKLNGSSKRKDHPDYSSDTHYEGTPTKGGII